MYFRPQGSIRILKALNTQFKYQEEDDYHITLFNSSNIQILFRLFKWFETSEGQIASTKLDTYSYVCGDKEYDDMNGLPICVLNEKSKFVSIEFYMNFRLGLPDLLPYRSLYYDPDLSAIFHRAKDKKKQDPTEPEDNEEEKKLQIAYIVAPVVTVVAVAAIIVGIVIFKKHKMAQQKKMTKESYELDTTEYDRGEEIDTIQPTQWKDGKKP